ncbi:MAG: heparinase II/III family protein, partial [Armatimonadota bacterium]
ELVRFVQQRIPELDTGPKIREYIEDSLLRVGGQAIIEEVIDGNPGFPQMAGMTIAAALDDYGPKYPNSADLIEWLYNGWGNFRFIFSNFLYPDGGGLESPGYSQIGLELLATAERIEAYRRIAPEALPEDEYPNLFGNPKIRAMLDFNIDIHCQGMGMPRIGDSGSPPLGRYRPPTSAPVWGDSKFQGYDIGFRRFDDPRYARVLVDNEGQLRWYDPVTSSESRVLKEAAAKVPSLIPREPDLFDGYGIAFLRSGSNASPRDVWLFYGAGRAHHHVDPLNLGLMAYQRHLLADLGYPLQLAKPYRMWENNIWTHNTVIVDEGYPKPPGSYGITHTPHGIVEMMSDLSNPETGLGAQLLRVSAPLQSVYRREDAPKITEYRRTVVLVDVSPDSFYVVDLFEVQGGSRHHLGYHFPGGDIEISGVDLQKRPGTLAGEHIEYADQIYQDGLFQGGYDPRSCMDKVRRGSAAEAYSGEWRAPDDEQVGFRITHLPSAGTEAVFARGRPPADPRKYQIQFMFARREGQPPLRSRFTSILEAFGDGTPVVEDVSRREVNGALVLDVTTEVGHDVLIFNAEDGLMLADANIVTDAAFAMVRKSGDTISAAMADGTVLEVEDLSLNAPGACIDAPILALDRDERTVTVDFHQDLSIAGQWVQIRNDARSGTYRVVQQSTDSRGRTVLALDRTSLLSEGIVEGVEDYTVLNDVQMPLGGIQNDRVVHIDLKGAYIQSRQGTYRIKNAEFGNFYTKRDNWDVHIDRDVHPQANAEHLAEDFAPGQLFEIHAYDAGDTLRFTPDAYLQRRSE